MREVPAPVVLDPEAMLVMGAVTMVPDRKLPGGGCRSAFGASRPLLRVPAKVP